MTVESVDGIAGLQAGSCRLAGPGACWRQRLWPGPVGCVPLRRCGRPVAAVAIAGGVQGDDMAAVAHHPPSPSRPSGAGRSRSRQRWRYRRTDPRQDADRDHLPAANSGVLSSGCRGRTHQPLGVKRCGSRTTITGYGTAGTGPRARAFATTATEDGRRRWPADGVSPRTAAKRSRLAWACSTVASRRPGCATSVGRRCG